MARSEARVSVDIWDTDEDWRALTSDAQWTYMFLLSQRDLAHDGVLALRERRWARSAAGMTVERIRRNLNELVESRFIVLDEDAGEVLIRSLLRRDKIYRQPNVLRAAADHLPLVVSHAIRLALAIELARITDEDMPDGSKLLVAEMRAALPNPSGNPSPDPSGNPSPEGHGKATGQGIAGTPGERGVVTAVSSDSPFPESPNPLPLASLAAAAPPTISQRSKKITDVYHRAEPMSRWPAVNAIVIKAIKAERWTDDEIEAALLRMASENRPVTVDSLRVELAGLPPSRASPRPALVEVNGRRVRPETAARFADRERFAAQDAAEEARLAIEGGP